MAEKKAPIAAAPLGTKSTSNNGALRPSGPNNKCPSCARTKDGDCRISADLLLCHRGSTHHPPDDLKPGKVIDGHDGQQWAYTRESDDGRSAVYTLHKPRSSGPQQPIRTPRSRRLNTIELARLPQPIATTSSTFTYSATQRVRRIDKGTSKRFACEHHDSKRWRAGAGPDAWPAWHEAEAIEHGSGKWIIEAEGEKCAGIVLAAGVVVITQPGHAHKPEQIQQRYGRLQAAGVAGVVFLADNDDMGANRAEQARQAAAAIGMELMVLPALAVWPGLPKGGSIDDAPGKPAESVEALAAAIKSRFATRGESPPARAAEPTLTERIAAGVDALLMATLAEDPNAVDAAMAELYRLGMSRERAQERTLHLWAERHGINLVGQQQQSAPPHGRCIGKGITPTTKGLSQQLPGFGLDRDLHLIVANGGSGKTLAAAELAICMTARDRGFLDHEAPRSDPPDDPRNTVLVIASDNEAGAFSMWESYLEELSAVERGAQIEIWAEDPETGEQPWVASLTGLERLEQRLKKGDLAAVIIDTANSVMRGAGINTGVGPVEAYLRLLKKIICRNCALWITHHTTRVASPDIKGIGGHPAFQEVPSVIHMIEAKKQSDGTHVRLWHVLKLRGSDYRRFAYENRDGVLTVTEGHFHENCAQQVLVALHQQRRAGAGGRASDLIAATKRPPSSVHAALSQLRSQRLIQRKGSAYWLTPTGLAMVEALRF